MNRLKTGDFPSHYFDEALKAQLRKYELNKQSNRWLVAAISDYYSDNEPLDKINSLDQIIKSVTKDDITTFAKNTFDNKFIEASLMPKKQ